MAEEKKPVQSVDEIVILAKDALKKSSLLVTEIPDETKRDEAARKATDLLRTEMSAALTGDKLSYAPSTEQAIEIATAIYKAQKAEADLPDNMKSKKLEVEPILASAPNGRKIGVSEYINALVAKKVQEKANEVVGKIGTVDRALGGEKGGDIIGEAFAAQERQFKSEAKSTILDNTIKAQLKFINEGEKTVKETDELLKKVPADKIAAMQTDAKEVMSRITTAVAARGDYLARKDAIEKATKESSTAPSEDQKKKDNEALEKLNTTAKEAEEAAGKKYKDTLDSYKEDDQKKAFKLVMQAAIDNNRDANNSKDWLKSASASGLDSELKGMLSTDRFAKMGVETAYTKAAGTAGVGGDGSKQWGKGIAGAAALAAGAFGAMRSGGTETGPDGQPQEKQMGFWGKVAVAIGVVGGLALLGSAVRKGDVTKGWKEGEGVIGKFTGMVQSSFAAGKYKGIGG